METINDVRNGLTDAEKRQLSMFGCTIAQMRETVAESMSFRYSGPAMYAMSMMSDAQEMLEHCDDFMVREDVRQLLNRAKWILSEYCMERKDEHV